MFKNYFIVCNDFILNFFPLLVINQLWYAINIRKCYGKRHGVFTRFSWTSFSKVGHYNNEKVNLMLVGEVNMDKKLNFI